MNNIEKAKLMIASVRAALANGVVHRNPKSGRWLRTETEVIDALRIYGAVDIDESRRVEATTTEAELAKLNAMSPTGRFRSEPNLQPLPVRTEAGARIRKAFTGKGGAGG